MKLQKKKQTLLEEVEENDSKLEMGDDTYTMAFKALHWETMKELDLNLNEVHDAVRAAIFVFLIQCTLIFILFIIITQSVDGFTIKLPTALPVLGARFTCSILMHLQVEGDMRQGLQMMKYAINHGKDFSNPFYAFFVAFMQSMGGMAAEIACIIFLCSLTDPIEIIIRFVAFASIGKIDNFYADALPAENKIKKDSEDMPIKVHRRDMWEKDDRKAANKFARFIYKTVRVVYAAFIFYFLPYLALFIPQFVDVAPATA